MKSVLAILILMVAASTMAQNGKANTVKKTFSRTTNVSIFIGSTAENVWGILTNAKGYPNWNSTIVSIEGEIVEGEKIRLISALDPSRAFKLKVKKMTINEKLVWGDALGERVYTLTKNDNGVLFNMTEKIGGLMFPLFAKKIPSFDESFEQFAADLKKAAE